MTKTRRAKVNKAIDLYQRFSGHEPKHLDTHKVEDYDTGMAIGPVGGIMYETVRDGVKEKYFHRFNEKDRPLLACSWDGRQLMMVGGNYDFTDEGIKDWNGEESDMAEEILLVNPRKRRRKTTKRRKAPARRKAAPVARRRRKSAAKRRTTRVRRNPAPRRGAFGMVQQSFMPAVQGAAGAVGLDLLLGYAPIPAQFKTGMGSYLVKGIGAVALGAVAGMVTNRTVARNMTQGALTVALTGAAREAVQTAVPGVQLGMMDDGLGYVGSGYAPAYLGTDGAMSTGMGEYLNYEAPSSLGAYPGGDVEDYAGY